MYGGSQRCHEKSLSAQQTVSMFYMLAQKTRQKAAIRPDKVEHFTHTFESLSPEIYAVMRIANAYFYSALSLRVISHQIVREPDCRGAVKRGLTVQLWPMKF